MTLATRSPGGGQLAALRRPALAHSPRGRRMQLEKKQFAGRERGNVRSDGDQKFTSVR